MTALHARLNSSAYEFLYDEHRNLVYDVSADLNIPAIRFLSPSNTLIIAWLSIIFIIIVYSYFAMAIALFVLGFKHNLNDSGLRHILRSFTHL